MICKNCGGDMIGDGVTIVIHCEHTDVDLLEVEPDAEPIYCNYDPYDERGHQG